MPKKIDYSSGEANLDFTYLSRIEKMEEEARFDRLSTPEVRERLRLIADADDAVLSPRARKLLRLKAGRTPASAMPLLGKTVLVKLRTSTDEVVKVPCRVLKAWRVAGNGRIMLNIAPVNGEGVATISAIHVDPCSR